jgi:hypothetical protein
MFFVCRFDKEKGEKWQEWTVRYFEIFFWISWLNSLQVASTSQSRSPQMAEPEATNLNAKVC